MSLKLTCDEATKICDKSQYGAISFLERLKLQYHILMCKICVKYSKQNSVMTKCLGKHKNSDQHTSPCLCKEEKVEMKEKIEEKI